MTPEQLRIHLHGPRDSRKSAARRRAIRDADNRAVEEVCAKYRRHTVDMKQGAPQYVEDEMLAVERGFRWAKVAWVVVGVLVAGYVVWRVLGGGE